jgi:hypothetical protein
VDIVFQSVCPAVGCPTDINYVKNVPLPTPAILQAQGIPVPTHSLPPRTVILIGISPLFNQNVAIYLTYVCSFKCIIDTTIALPIPLKLRKSNNDHLVGSQTIPKREKKKFHFMHRKVSQLLHVGTGMILQIFIIFQKFVSCIQEKKFMIGVFPRYIGAGNFVHAIWCLNSFSIHYCISQL